MTVLHDDAGRVPGCDVEGFLFGSRNQVVERTQLAVALHAKLGIGVAQVVQDLELAADGAAFALVHIGVHEILDAAVGTFRNLEVHLQDEVVVGTSGHDVAAVSALCAVGLLHLQDAVLDAPSLLGEALQLGAAPSFGCLAVPQQFPSLALFLLGQGVVRTGWFRCLYHLLLGCSDGHDRQQGH